MVKYHIGRHGGRTVTVVLLRPRKHTHGRRFFYHKRHWKIFNPSNEVYRIKTSILAQNVEGLMISVFAGLVGADRAIYQVKGFTVSPHGPRPQDICLESAPVAVHYYSRYELRVA